MRLVRSSLLKERMQTTVFEVIFVIKSHAMVMWIGLQNTGGEPVATMFHIDSYIQMNTRRHKWKFTKKIRKNGEKNRQRESIRVSGREPFFIVAWEMGNMLQTWQMQIYLRNWWHLKATSLFGSTMFGATSNEMYSEGLRNALISET